MIRLLTPDERRALYQEGRARTANRWFNGDEHAAENALAVLPYGDIPDWDDLEAAITAFRGLQEAPNSRPRHP